jgi:hypothetical protein
VIDELPQQLDGGLRGHVVLVRHGDVVHENSTKMTTKCTKWS